MNNAQPKDDWEPGTLYLRHFDKEGKSYVAEHICWHMTRFMAAAQEAALDAGGHIEQVTERDYLATKVHK